MTLDDADLDAVLTELREHGTTIQEGGSRCHTDYGFSNGQWTAIEFDEGYTEERVLSEGDLRRRLAQLPDEVARALDAGRWRACKVALLAKDWPSVSRALEGRRAVDSLRTADVLVAVCVWPEAEVSAELRDYISREDRSHTLFHKFMTGVGWTKGDAVVDAANAWLDRAEAMVGAKLETTRAQFARSASGTS